LYRSLENRNAAFFQCVESLNSTAAESPIGLPDLQENELAVRWDIAMHGFALIFIQ